LEKRIVDKVVVPTIIGVNPAIISTSSCIRRYNFNNVPSLNH